MKENKVTEGSKITGAQEAVLHDFVVEFRRYKTELNKKFLQRKPWIPPDESKILSFIPGTVVKIHVSEGQDVSAGQELLTLEAMKMNNSVLAGRSGKIIKILVREGEQVPKSMVLVEMELH